MTDTTRLSLYKLLLPTTTYLEVSGHEYSRMLAWMAENRSRTSRRNAVDNLFETFIWFPTFDGTCLFIPLGHLTRLTAQVSQRIGARAGPDHPNVVFRTWLGQPRAERSGDEVLQIRLRQVALVTG